jgi:chromosome segregation ATPase
LKTYRVCREKKASLQKELTEVNNKIEKKRVEIEHLREELREICSKEEKLRRKRDKLSMKYVGFKKKNLQRGSEYNQKLQQERNRRGAS